MRRLLLIAVVLCVVTLYILAVATGNTGFFAQYFWWAFVFGSVLLISLAAVACTYWWRLLRSRRRKEFGSKTAMRLAAMFTLVAVLPGLFLFGVSAQFISHSIHSWFGSDTEEALNRSLNLSKSALNYESDNTLRRAFSLQVALLAASGMNQSKEAVLHREGRNKGFSQLVYIDLKKREIMAEYNPRRLPAPVLDGPRAAALDKNGSVRELENVNDILYVQGWLPVTDHTGHDAALFFRQPVPEKVARDATLIENARAKYAELSYAKQGLQTFFLATLLMATLLAIVLALLVALYFSRRFVAPILSLAEGARAVAAGDLSVRTVSNGNDELGQLGNLFNQMTDSLADAKSRQEAARHYLEYILDSLTTGVVTLDSEGYVKTANRMAEDILSCPTAFFTRCRPDTFSGTGQEAAAAAALATITATVGDSRPIQIAYEHEDGTRILLGKAAALPEDSGSGTLLVFDDVTALVRAQKEAAWGEVAQRLAHEIRNPLTPIQLSAERLAWKLDGKLDNDGSRILHRATETIIRQVAAMKDMVEEFRNYARTPALNPVKMDLNALIREILLLYEGSRCTFSVGLSNMPLYVYADSGALRQVVHNIVKNAGEAAEAGESPEVAVTTHIQDGHVVIEVADNGKGFSKEMLARAFDPYVTDKAGGTGLGLPVVKKIVEEHGGKIRISNREEGGALVKITLLLQTETADA